MIETGSFSGRYAPHERGTTSCLEVRRSTQGQARRLLLDVTIYEGGGINNGWAGHRDPALGPEW